MTKLKHLYLNDNWFDYDQIDTLGGLDESDFSLDPQKIVKYCMENPYTIKEKLEKAGLLP